MDTLKRITITASLIATMGNSLATNNLSSFVSVPGGGMVEIVIWMTAFEGQTPGPCKNVAIVAYSGEDEHRFRRNVNT